MDNLRSPPLTQRMWVIVPKTEPRAIRQGYSFINESHMEEYEPSYSSGSIFSSEKAAQEFIDTCLDGRRAFLEQYHEIKEIEIRFIDND